MEFFKYEVSLFSNERRFGDTLECNLYRFSTKHYYGTVYDDISSIKAMLIKEGLLDKDSMHSMYYCGKGKV